MQKSKVGLAVIATIAIALSATATQAVVVDDILNLAIPAPYSLSPDELQEKYKNLVRIEEPYTIGKQNYKTTSFHSYELRAEENETKWEQSVTLTYVIHQRPRAWITWKWVESKHPMFGAMGYYQPESCWEWNGKLRQVWGKRETI